MSGDHDDDRTIEGVLADFIGAKPARRYLLAFDRAYVRGEYERALPILRYLMRCAPVTASELEVFAWRCETVIERSATEGDVEGCTVRAIWDGSGILRKCWLAIRGKRPPTDEVRCKWCGWYNRRQSDSIFPAPYCRHCSRPYRDPDLYWDSMDGFAYCAGRGSWYDKQKEIEAEWNEFYDRRRWDLSSRALDLLE